MCIRDRRYLVKKHKFPEEYLTTAWFLESIRKWFDLISSRTNQLALSRFNQEKSEEAFSFLQDIIYLFKEIKIGQKGHWKPIQTGVITTTTSILGVADLLLNKKGLSYVMTSRFSQDPLENLFSQVRLKQPIPSAKEFKSNLRAITIAQFLTQKKNSNYQQDESVYLADFLDMIGTSSSNKSKPVFILPTALSSNSVIDEKEKDVLRYISGHVIFSVKKSSKTCEKCIGIVSDPDPPRELLGYTQFRDFTGHSLIHCRESFFQKVFLKAEQDFR